MAARTRASVEREQLKLRLDGGIENKLIREGISILAGTDEVGRGALAGPIVACAINFFHDSFTHHIAGIKDSKELSATKRCEMKALLEDLQFDHSISSVSNTEIDSIGIQSANFEAIRRAVQGLSNKPEVVLVDGYSIPMENIRTIKVVGGDKKCYSIGAASIIAKVFRDAVMDQLDLKYPEYGFSQHKGYGTAKHIESIKKYGPAPVHRLSFKPISGLLV